MDKKDTKKTAAREQQPRQPKENKKVNPTWEAAMRLQGAIVILDKKYFDN